MVVPTMDAFDHDVPDGEWSESEFDDECDTEDEVTSDGDLEHDDNDEGDDENDEDGAPDGPAVPARDRIRLLAFAKQSRLWVTAGTDMQVVEFDGNDVPRVVGRVSSAAVPPRAGKEPLTVATAHARACAAVDALRESCPLPREQNDDILVDRPQRIPSEGEAAVPDQDVEGGIRIYPLHGLSLCGNDRMITVLQNRLRLSLVTPDHLVLSQNFHDRAEDGSVYVELNRRELTGLLWYFDWDAIFEKGDSEANIALATLLESIQLSQYSGCWLRAAINVDQHCAVQAIEALWAHVQVALTTRAPATPWERARHSEVFAVYATVTAKFRAGVAEVYDEELMSRLEHVLPKWSAELDRLSSLARTPDLRCSPSHLANLGFYCDETRDGTDARRSHQLPARPNRYSPQGDPGVRSAMPRAACATNELPWGLACSIPLSTCVATQPTRLHTSGEAIEFFASSLGAPRWALTGSSDGEIALWSTMDGLKHAVGFNCRAQSQMAPMDDQLWLSGPLVGVHLLCHHWPLGAVCVLSVFNSDALSVVVRVHMLTPKLDNHMVNDTKGSNVSPIAGGNRDKELQCKLCMERPCHFSSRLRLAQHMAEKHAEQALIESYDFDDATWVQDQPVILMDVFASALLEAPHSHWLLLAATCEIGEPQLAVGNVHDFTMCCHHPHCMSTQESAATTMSKSWKYHSLVDYVDPELWSCEGQVHIEAIGEPFSRYAALLVDGRTSVLLVNIETGAVTPTYTSLGPTIADFDVNMVEGIIGVVHDDGSLASATFILDEDDGVDAVDDVGGDPNERRAEQLEQSHSVLKMSPAPLTKLVSDTPGHCIWQLASSTEFRYSGEFQAIQLPASSDTVPRESLDLACHIRDLYFITHVRIECSFPATATGGSLPVVAVRFAVEGDAIQDGTQFSFSSTKREQRDGAVVHPIMFSDPALSVTATKCVIFRFQSSAGGGGGGGPPVLPFRIRLSLFGCANRAVQRNTLALPRSTMLDFANFDELYPSLLKILESDKSMRRLRDAAVALLHQVVMFRKRKHIIRLAQIADFRKIITNSILLDDQIGKSRTCEFLVVFIKAVQTCIPSTPCDGQSAGSPSIGWCRTCAKCKLRFSVVNACLAALDDVKSLCRSSCRMSDFFNLLQACRHIDDGNVASALLESLLTTARELKEGLHAAPIYAQLLDQCNVCDYIFEPACFTLPLTFVNGIHESMQGTPRMYGQTECVSMVADARNRGVDVICPLAGEHMLTSRYRLVFRGGQAMLDMKGKQHLTHIRLELPEDSGRTRITVAVGSSAARSPDDQVYSDFVDPGPGGSVVTLLPSQTVCRYISVAAVTAPSAADPASGRFQNFAPSAAVVLFAAYGVPICHDGTDADQDGPGMQLPLVVLQRLQAQDNEARHELEHRQRALKRLMAKPQARNCHARAESKRIDAALRATRLAMAQVFCARWALIRFAEENASRYQIEPPPLLDCRLSRLSVYAHALMDACAYLWSDGASPLPHLDDGMVDKLFTSLCVGQGQRLEEHGVQLLQKLPISKYSWSRVLIRSLASRETRGGGISSARPRYTQIKDLALALGFGTATPNNPLLLAIVEMVIPWIDEGKMEIALLSGGFKLFLDLMADVEKGNAITQQVQTIDGARPDPARRIRIQVNKPGSEMQLFDMDPSLPFQMLIVRYVTKCRVSRNDIDFVYGGQSILPNQTPASLDMSEGALVMVRPKKVRRQVKCLPSEAACVCDGIPYVVPRLPRCNCLIRVAPDPAAEVIGHYVEGSRVLAVDFQGDWMKVVCSMQDKGAVWRIDRSDEAFHGWIRHTAQGAEIVQLDTTSQQWSSFGVVTVRTTADPEERSMTFKHVCRTTCFAVLLHKFAEAYQLDPADFVAKHNGQRIWGYNVLSEVDSRTVVIDLEPIGPDADHTDEATPEFITLQVISKATYLHREVNSTDEPQPKDNIERMFVKFATGRCLGNLSTIYSTQESTCPNMLNVRYAGSVRKYDDTPAALGMVDMSTVHIDVPRDSSRARSESSARPRASSGKLKPPEPTSASSPAASPSPTPKRASLMLATRSRTDSRGRIASVMGEDLGDEAVLDHMMAITNMIPAQLFGILADPAISLPVRPVVFVLITKTLMTVFSSCAMPSLVSILQHPDMPTFLYRISLERNDDARARVQKLIQRIVAATINLLGAMTGDTAAAVLVAPSPLSFFIRNVCSLIERSLSEKSRCTKSNTVQLTFLLEILLPAPDMLAQRNDLHPHHTMRRPKQDESIHCSCCKGTVPQGMAQFAQTCSEPSCDFAVCPMCSPLPTARDVVECLSDECVLQVIEEALPTNITTFNEKHRCSMVLQLAAHLRPTALAKSDVWWRAVQLVVLSGDAALLWQVRMVLNTMLEDPDCTWVALEKLYDVVARSMPSVDGAACKGMWQMLLFLCSAWSNRDLSDGHEHLILKRHLALIACIMKHILTYGRQQKRADAALVDKWLSCYFFLMTESTTQLILAKPPAEYDQEMKDDLGYALSMVPLRYEMWSTRTKGNNTTKANGSFEPSAVDIVLRALQMSGYKELDDALSSPLEACEPIAHHELRLLGGARMFLQFLIFPNNNYFAVNVMSETTARLGVAAVKSGAYSMMLSTLQCQDVVPIIVKHIGPIVFELVHNLGIVVSGVAPLVKSATLNVGGDDSVPSLDNTLAFAQRALQFLQVLGLKNDIAKVCADMVHLDDLIDDCVKLIPYVHELVGDVLANIAVHHTERAVDIVRAAVNELHLPQAKVYSAVIRQVITSVVGTRHFNECSDVIYQFLMSNPYEMFTSLNSMMQVLAEMMDCYDEHPCDAELASQMLDKALQYISFSFHSMSEEILFSISRNATAPGNTSAGLSKVTSDIAMKYSVMLSAMDGACPDRCFDRDQYTHALQWVLRPGTRVQAVCRHGAVTKGDFGTYISSSTGVCWDKHAPETELVPYEMLTLASESSSKLSYARRGIICMRDPPLVSELGDPLGNVAPLSYGQIVAIVSDSPTRVVVRDNTGSEYMLAAESALQISYAEDLLVEPAEVEACRGAMTIVAQILRHHPVLVDRFLSTALAHCEPGGAGLEAPSAALEHLAGALMMTDDVVKEGCTKRGTCEKMCTWVMELVEGDDSLRGLGKVLPTLRMLAHASLYGKCFALPQRGFIGLIQLASRIATGARERRICPCTEENSLFFIGLIMRNYEVTNPDVSVWLTEKDAWQNLPSDVSVRLFWHFDVVSQASPPPAALGDNTQSLPVHSRRGLLRIRGKPIRLGESLSIVCTHNGETLWTGVLNSMTRGLFGIRGNDERRDRIFPFAMFRSGDMDVVPHGPNTETCAASASTSNEPRMINARFISNLATSGDLPRFFDCALKRFDDEPVGSTARVVETARIAALQRIFGASRGVLKRASAKLAAAFHIPGVAQQLLQSRMGTAVMLSLGGYFDPRRCVSTIREDSLEVFALGQLKEALAAGTVDVDSRLLAKLLLTILNAIEADDRNNMAPDVVSFGLDDVRLQAAYNCAIRNGQGGTWCITAAEMRSGRLPHGIAQSSRTRSVYDSHYFEVALLDVGVDDGSDVSVGLLPLSAKNVWLDNDTNCARPTTGVWYSIQGTVSIDGRFVGQSRRPKKGDVIGCGMNLKSKMVYFTINKDVICAFFWTASRGALSPAIAFQGEMVLRPSALPSEMLCQAESRTSTALHNLPTSAWLKVPGPASLVKKTSVGGPTTGAATDDSGTNGSGGSGDHGEPVSNFERQLLGRRLELVTMIMSCNKTDEELLIDTIRRSTLPRVLVNLMAVESCTTVNKNLRLYQVVVELVDKIFPMAFSGDLATEMQAAIKSMGQCSSLFLRTRDGALRTIPGAAPDTVVLAEKVVRLMASLKSYEDGEKLAIHPVRTEYFNVFSAQRVKEAEIDEATFAFADRAQEGGIGQHNKMERIIGEISDLSQSLPCERTHAIFVRYDANRFDKMRVLITGATSTPYEGGCFLFDVYCPSGYPDRPPLVHLLTTGRGTVRFNPNLYVTGKVCLSLLGTWEGDAQETWTRDSSLEQVFASIQSLIMHSEIYWNEPNAPSENAARLNIGYCNIVRYNTIKYAITDHINNPPPIFGLLILKHLYHQRSRIMKVHEEWIRDAEAQVRATDESERPLYGGFVKLHNHELARQFDASPKAYLDALRAEVSRAREALLRLEDVYLPADDEFDRDDSSESESESESSDDESD
eukprot:m.163522 g.163522  ORF g.163522 m.163522 type:complete len:4187 (+) comp12313_c0_seq1:142-12702(+)